MRALILVIAALFQAPSAHALIFEAHSSDGMEWVDASGVIEDGDSERLQSMLSKHPLITIVNLDSPGGTIVSALELGRMIRSKGLMTAVDSRNVCASACFFAFVGGVERYAEGGTVGVHQFYRDKQYNDGAQAMASAQTVTAKLLAYAREMDVDAEAVEIGLRTAPASMHFFMLEELDKWRVRFEPKDEEREVWNSIVVPGFLARHSEYAPGTQRMISLDYKVRQLQAAAANRYDPKILEQAHREIQDAISLLSVNDPDGEVWLKERRDKIDEILSEKVEPFRGWATSEELDALFSGKGPTEQKLEDFRLGE